MHSYDQLKSDVDLLAKEIVALGGSLGGGYDRAAVEYWLEPSVLGDSKPTPLPVKLAVAIAICTLKHAAALPVEPEDEEPIETLLPLLTPSQVQSSFSSPDLIQMHADSSAVLSPRLLNAVTPFLASAIGA